MIYSESDKEQNKKTKMSYNCKKQIIKMIKQNKIKWTTEIKFKFKLKKNN